MDCSYAPPNLPRAGQNLEQQNDDNLEPAAERLSNKHMDIEVVKRSGQGLSTKEDLSEALQAFAEDGFLILKRATSIEPPSAESLESLSFVKREIVLNKVSYF